MCGVQLKDRKISTDLMLMFGLNKTIDQLVTANSVHWYGHVLWRDIYIHSSIACHPRRGYGTLPW